MEITDTIRTVLKFKGHEVWTVQPEESVYEALRTMSDRGIGALLVLKGGKLVGLFSERDYARKVILMGRTSRETTVEEIMTSPVVSASPDETVKGCVHIMTAQRIRHLPIVESDRIVGLVSIGDLVSWIIQAQAETIGHLHTYIAGAYPG